MSWRVESDFHFMEMIMASAWRTDLKGQDSDHPVERQWWSRAQSPRTDPERQLQLMFRKQTQYSLMVEYGEGGVKVLAGATRRMGCCFPSRGFRRRRSRFWGGMRTVINSGPGMLSSEGKPGEQGIKSYRG